MTEQEPVSNKFITTVEINLSSDQWQQILRYLNLHYLGDVDANEYDENGNLVAKYPEKETDEFKNAIWNACASHRVEVMVTYDVNGKPYLEYIND